MAEFEAFEADVEVTGQTVLAFVEGVPAAFEDRALEILADHGIEDPQPGEWYSQQAWLDAIEDIDAQIGAATLTRIGEQVPRTAEWPSTAELVVGALELIDEAYRLNHRNGEIGSYDAEQVATDAVRVHCNNPYPCPFDKGLVRAVAEDVSLQQDVFVTEESDQCRSDGGDECLYRVEL